MYNKDEWNVDLDDFEVESLKYKFHDFVKMKHNSSMFIPITICHGTESILNVHGDTVIAVVGRTLNDNIVIAVLVDFNCGDRRYAYSNVTTEDYTSLLAGQTSVNNIQNKSDMYVVEYDTYGRTVQWYKLPFILDQYISTNAQSLVWNKLK